MSEGFNRLIISGNLTRDPELKESSNGTAYCKLGVAVNSKYRNNETGSYEEEVCFIDVTTFGNQARFCGQYMKKGNGVLVEGRLKFEEWTDKSGEKRIKHTMTSEKIQFTQRIAETNNA